MPICMDCDGAKDDCVYRGKWMLVLCKDCHTERMELWRETALGDYA